MADRSVTFTLIGKDQASPALDKVGKSMGDLDDRASRTEKSLRSLAEGAIAGQVASKMKDFLTGSITAASDLNETMSKTKAVFGPASAQIIAFGQNADKALGQSQTQALDAADNFGNLFKNIGLTTDQSAKMSMQLVTTASDLASFFNTDPSQMLEAVSSALAGEYDPLQRYGMAINAAAVEQEALNLGLANSKKEITPAIQAQAAYSLILKQTGAAAGDFARTSDGLANQQRIVAAEWTNMKASLGEALLPVVKEAVTVGNQLLGVFMGIPAPVRNTVAGVAALAVGLSAGALAVAKVKDAFTELGVGTDLVRSKFVTTEGETTRLGTAMGTLSRATAAVGTAVVGLNVASAALGSSASVGINQATNALNDYAKSGKMADVVTSDWDHTLTRVTDSGFEGLMNSIGGVTESLTGLGALDWGGGSIEHAVEQFRSLDAALAQMATNGSADQAAAAFQRLKADTDAHGVSAERLRELLPQYTDALAGATAATQQHGGATETATTKAAALKSQLAELTQQLDSSKNAFLTGRDAENQYWAALDSATASLKANGSTMDVHTEKGRANRQALDGMAEASTKYLQSVLDQQGPGAAFDAKLTTTREQLLKTAEQFLGSKEKAKLYTDAVLAIPATKTTTITANTSTAMANVQALTQRIAMVQGKTVYIDVITTSSNVREDRTIAKSRGGWVPAVAGSTPGIDSVPAVLTPREFVVRESQAAKWGPVLNAINSGASADIVAGQIGASAPSGGTGGSIVVNVTAAAVGSEDYLARLIRTVLLEARERGQLAAVGLG